MNHMISNLTQLEDMLFNYFDVNGDNDLSADEWRDGFFPIKRWAGVNQGSGIVAATISGLEFLSEMWPIPVPTVDPEGEYTFDTFDALTKKSSFWIISIPGEEMTETDQQMAAGADRRVHERQLYRKMDIEAICEEATNCRESIS